VQLLQHDHSFIPLSSAELVPGDIIVVPSDANLPVDLILMTGSALVNESMLTGESIPVIKTSIPHTDEVYSDVKSTKHILYSGTKVIQTKHIRNNKVLGLVRNTGYLTAKGSIIREILYPTKLSFKFEHESEKFILLGAIIAVFAICAVIPIMMHKQTSDTEFMIDASLNMFTFTVPPALPAALTVGTFFAVLRLKKSNIFCIHPQRVNLAARLKTFVFDKTGTLTEDSISILGVMPIVPVQDASFLPTFSEEMCSPGSLQPVDRWWEHADGHKYRETNETLLLEALASC
jgi:cation-transporting P-type ATPase 13A2